MKNLILLIRHLQYSSDHLLLKEKLYELKDEINNLILQIKKCENLEEAQPFFALLDYMQSLIMVLAFKKDMSIPMDLWRFTKDFDRIDDSETQLYIFNQIKHNRYPLIDLENS